MTWVADPVRRLLTLYWFVPGEHSLGSSCHILAKFVYGKC